MSLMSVKINPASEGWCAVDHKNKIHHITRSAIVWNSASERLQSCERDEVTHAILAHHGRREWGSPVIPQTRMAWLLHLCDGISARIDDCVKSPEMSV